MCTKQKVEIINNIKRNGTKAINRRWEVYRKCLHQGAFLLGTINTKKKTQTENLVVEGAGSQRSFERGRGEVREWGQTRSGGTWRKND